MKDEEVIFSLTKFGEVKGHGYGIRAEADDRYFRGIAQAIAEWATQDGIFYAALIEALDEIKKGR